MGFVDLHCHYLPGIDDGVDSLEDGLALCAGLKKLGFTKVTATPHIRTAMFENDMAGIQQAYSDFQGAADKRDDLPELALGAEHFFDDKIWELFQTGRAVHYQNGACALIELPRRRFPANLEKAFFQLGLKGIKPVLAHPERYHPLFRRSDDLDALVNAGALPLLDVMSLIGKYGRRPKKAAERILLDGDYYAACTDSHRASDVEDVAKAIERLIELVGEGYAKTLFSSRPERILAGTAEFE